ncbi:hypothetical protein [Bradyrhizobium lupini]|uniref:hypothetical protein n=1 Tax=Rhizobium lupini TaxID=136996 RepID=UPI0034C5E767
MAERVHAAPRFRIWLRDAHPALTVQQMETVMMKVCRRCEHNLPLSRFRTGKKAPRVCESCLSKLIAGAVFTMNPTEAASFMARLEASETLRTIVGGGGTTICSKKAFDKHCELYPEWGAKALGLAACNRKLADKRKGRSNPNLPARPTNVTEDDLPTFPELKARNFSIPDCAAIDTCRNCPHPADCAALAECLDKINARAAIPHQEEYMRPEQAVACMSVLEKGMSKRWLTGYVKGTKAIVSANKFEKHCERYRNWGAWAAALVQRNRKLADKKKGHRGGRDFCAQGHSYAIHGKSYLQNDGRWHRQCLTCVGLRSRNPTHTPKQELVEKVRAAVIAGTRVTVLTDRHTAAFVCDFRQIRAIRRLHHDIAEMIDRNSQQPRLIVPRPAIIRSSNLREPTLTGIIAAPADPLFTLADQVIPRNLPPHIRRPAVSSLAAALWLKEVTPEDAGRIAKMFVKAAWKEDAVDRRFISLDAPAFRDGSVPLIERISERQGLWA